MRTPCSNKKVGLRAYIFIVHFLHIGKIPSTFLLKRDTRIVGLNTLIYLVEKESSESQYSGEVRERKNRVNNYKSQ